MPSIWPWGGLGVALGWLWVAFGSKTLSQEGEVRLIMRIAAPHLSGGFPSAQGHQRIQKVLWPWGFRTQTLSRSRMDESQPAGMQHLPGCGVAGQLRHALVLPVAVGRVAHERKAEELEVHPDLVGAAGVQDRLDKRRPLQPLQHAIVRPRLASDVVVHGHALAVGGMPGDARSDFAPVARQFPAEDSVVNLLHLPSGELGGEREE